jgi:DNA polymerase III delta prime subunit
MQQLILAGGNATLRSQTLTELFPPTHFLTTHLVAEKNSIPIKAIHDLLTSLSLTSASSRLVWIENAQYLTLPAQNALLKVLEEPPHNTSFVLTVTTTNALLPTIRSRCQLKQIGSPEIGDETVLTTLKQVLQNDPGNRLVMARDLGKDKETILLWLTQVLLALHQKIKSQNNPRQLSLLVKLAKLSQITHTQISHNVHTGLVLQDYFLSLPKTK